MDIQGKKAVVTGGAGFIGSHLVDALLSKGLKVIVIDDFSSGSKENLVHHGDNPLLTVSSSDICDYHAIAPWFQGADIVFHLACRNVRLSLMHPTEVHETNISGTFNVLKASAEHNISRFLYCSSSEVNGTAEIVPMPERYHYAPETIYGASKLAGEYYTQVFQRSGWLSTVIARPHNNYGPREHYQGHHGEVIPRFILWALSGKKMKIYGDGMQTRDFTYVTETVQYLIRLLECDDAVGDTFNICRGEEVSILRITELIIELTESRLLPEHLPGRPSDVLRLYGDPSRLRSVLGDSPHISIREGLEKTIDWFRAKVHITDELLSSLSPENWKSGASELWLKKRTDLGGV